MRLVLALVVASVVLVAGCVQRPAAQSDPREDRETDDASLRPVVERFEGSVAGSFVEPGVVEFPFEVPRAAVGLNGTLAWSRRPLDLPRDFEPLALELVDPAGEVVASGYEDVEGRLVVATVDPPKAGRWVFRVFGRDPVGTSFVLDAVAELIVPEANVVARSLVLGQRSFYEVNMILEANASFRFSFNASGAVRWDVHSHPPEGLKTWEEGEGTSAVVEFVAPHRDVYSVLWENPAALPVDLSFEIVGAFRVHSHSG